MTSVRALPLPRLRPLLFTVALLLGLAAGGGLKHASANPLPTYRIAVTYTTIAFPAIDDSGFLYCLCDSGQGPAYAEAYGALSAAATNQARYGGNGEGSRGSLDLSHPGGEPGYCSDFYHGTGSDVAVPWGTTDPNLGPCHRLVWNGGTYDFASTLLCAANDADHCAHSWGMHHNTIVVDAHPGDGIALHVKLLDRDEFSADDVICQVSKKYGPFSEAQLASLSISDSASMAFNGDGACAVQFTLTRIP